MNSIYLILPYLKERRYYVVLGILLLICVDFLQLLIPRIIKWAVDDLTALRIHPTMLLKYAAYMIVIALMIGIFRYGWRHCLIGLSRRAEEGLRNRLFSHIQTLSAGYFDNTKTGDLMAHATNDIQHVRMALGMGIVALTDAVVLGTAAIGFMLYINVRLTLYVLIPMPFIAVGARFFSKRMHRLYGEVQGMFADLTEVVRERFAGIRVIKAYTMEKSEYSRFEKKSKQYIDSNIRLVKITGLFFPMMILFTNISMAMVLFIGGRQTIYTVITPGDFVAFIAYLGLLMWPMMALGWVTNLIQRGRASLDRINKIIETPPQIIDSPSPKRMGKPLGHVVFDNVFFSYSANGNKVLNGINFTLEPGQILGIVGPPGSGKTTLLSLLPRLYDVTSGRILVDHIDIRDRKVQDLRAQISFVPQEPFLFAGSVRENITLGAARTADEDLVEVITKASLYETIQSFPQGFDTIVGEKGVILSGGQKQRIALARALLQERAILALDDPVSQVDVETAMRIINTIKTLARSRTLFIVSHRLSAVRFADTIIAMDNGQIVGTGAHSDLLEKSEYYANTYHLQEIEEEYSAH